MLELDPPAAVGFCLHHCNATSSAGLSPGSKFAPVMQFAQGHGELHFLLYVLTCKTSLDQDCSIEALSEESANNKTKKQIIKRGENFAHTVDSWLSP